MSTLPGAEVFVSPSPLETDSIVWFLIFHMETVLTDIVIVLFPLESYVIARGH